METYKIETKSYENECKCDLNQDKLHYNLLENCIGVSCIQTRKKKGYKLIEKVEFIIGLSFEEIEYARISNDKNILYLMFEGSIQKKIFNKLKRGLRQ